MLGALAASLLCASLTSGVELEFNGFGDITAGTNRGGPADGSDYANFKAFGPADELFNENDGFGIVGTDFVLTAHLTERLTYQGEINFQTDRGSIDEIEIDAERFYLDYELNEWLSVQGGLFFTPIGYHNRFLYSRAWLLHSIQVSDLFEEELNLMPTHTVGLQAHGTVELGGQSFNYAMGLGNARGETPDSTSYARKGFGGGLEVSGLVEWVPAGTDGTLIVGISGWHSTIHTALVGSGLGTTADPELAPRAKLSERGADAYVTYFGEHFNVLFETFYGAVHDQRGNQPRDSVWTGGLTAELSLNLSNNRMHPYLRYDVTRLPDPSDDPFYGLREEGGLLVRTFVTEFDGLMTGVSFDLNAHTRLKTEVLRNFDGAREDWAVQAQVAFGF
jgi:hypothetical protein